jgi:hypothetical protein
VKRASLLRRSAAGGPSAAVAPATAQPARWPFEWIYFAATMIAWSFSPLVRRLIDFHNGYFNPVSIVSLVPFVMVVPMAYFCVAKNRWARLDGLFKRLVYVWIATFAYGFVIAAAFGNLGAAMFSLVQYLVPMIAGCWLAAQEMPAPQLYRRLCLIVLPCAAVVSLYGIAQWVNPPPWDVLWIQGSGFESAFNPVPFGMRIFSTLNSPQPAADFWSLTIVMVLPLLRLRNLWTWPLLAGLGSGLLLTLVREAWVGLIVGVLAYVLLSPRRLSAVPAIALFVGLLAVIVTALPVMLGSGPDSDVISSRITTFGDVSHDDSALARQGEIRDAAAQGLANPLGSGLGTIGAAARLGSSSQGSIGTVLDSGYLSRFIELGWLGIIGYLAVSVGGPLVMAYRLIALPSATPMDVETKVVGAAALAIGVVLAWADAANDSHFGLDGVFFWLALGLASVAVRAPQRSTEPALAKPAREKGLRRFA